MAAGGQQIVQPFQSGAPLQANRSHLFKGRKQLADDPTRHVLSQGRPALILHGPWRCGKSSLLFVGTGDCDADAGRGSRGIIA